MANKRGVYAPVYAPAPARILNQIRICAPSFRPFKLFHEKNGGVHE